MVAQRQPEQILTRRRMEAVFLGFLASLVLIGLRLAYVQTVQARGFEAMANRIQAKTFEMEPVRGDITDRNGNEMATNVLAKTVMINPRVPKDPDATASRIVEILRLDPSRKGVLADDIETADARKRYYLRIERGVERKKAEHLIEESKEDKRLAGIWLEDSPQRVNPAGLDGRQIIGAVNVDGIGIEAIELFCNPALQGTSGTRTVRVNGVGVPIPNSDIKPPKDPVDGNDVKLTIDRDLQHIVEAEMQQLKADQSPDYAVAIVMDVKTGDVLATCSLPAFDPKEKDPKKMQEMRKNRAVTDTFEPGSIFKVITAAAALEAGINTHTGCYGRRQIGRYSVGCAHGTTHGAVDLREMIEQSCNLAAGTYAERIGPQKMYDFMKASGIVGKTGIEFPGEVSGWVDPPAKWRTLNTVNIGFGQGVSMTPIQLLAAYAAVANDGVYNPPRLVLEAPGMESKLGERKSRRVMSARNAETLRGYMEGVVTNGTGTRAKIPGYSVGGKTGTAQISEGKRGYTGGYVSSFAGFVPAVKPRLAILVSAWRAKNGHYGGTVAAPVFREIARQCVAYMKIPPDRPNDTRDGAIPGSGRRSGGGRD